MAYQKKIAVDLDCPLRLTMSLIESKWKSCILDELRDGSPQRPSEIHKCLPEAAPRVLDIQLREMEKDWLVVKTIYPELPPRSEYRITDLGQSLIPIIDMMLKWGEDHFEVFEKKYGRQTEESWTIAPRRLEASALQRQSCLLCRRNISWPLRKKLHINHDGEIEAWQPQEYFVTLRCKTANNSGWRVGHIINKR